MVRCIIILGVLLVSLAACDPVSSGGGVDGSVAIDGGGGELDARPAFDAGPDASTAACAAEPACGAPTLIASKSDLREIVDGCDERPHVSEDEPLHR